MENKKIVSEFNRNTGEIPVEFETPPNVIGKKESEVSPEGGVANGEPHNLGAVEAQRPSQDAIVATTVEDIENLDGSIAINVPGTNPEEKLLNLLNDFPEKNARDVIDSLKGISSQDTATP